jgi:hypothetical protein
VGAEEGLVKVTFGEGFVLCFSLCGCIWSAVCHNSDWFSACVLPLVGVSLTVTL